MRAGLALLVIASILALSFATQANAAPVAQGVTLDTKSSTWPVARRLMQLLGFIKEAGPAVPAPAAAPKAPEQAKPAAAAQPVVQAKSAAAQPQPAAQAKPAVQAKAEQVVQKPIVKEEPKQPAKPVEQPKQPAAVPPQQKNLVEAPKPKLVEQPAKQPAPQQQQKQQQQPSKPVEQPQAPKQQPQAPKQQQKPAESVPGPWEQNPPRAKQAPQPSIKNNSPFSGSKGHNDDDLGSLIDDVLAPGKSHKPEYKPEYKDDEPYYEEEEKRSYYKKPSYDSEHLREIYNKGGNNKKSGDDYWYGDDAPSNKQYHNNDKKGDEYYGRKPEPRYYEPRGDSHYEAPRDSKYYEKPHYEAPSHYEPRDKYYEAPHHSSEPIKRSPTYDAPKPRYGYKPEHPAPRGRPGYDHRGDEEDASYDAPKSLKPDHDYSEYNINGKHSYQDLKHGYESLQKDYEEISNRYDLEDKYSSYKDNKSAYEQLRDKLESKAAVDELKGLYDGLKKMFDELKNTISDQEKKEQWKHEVEEKLRKEAEEKKEYEEYVAKRKAQEAERKAAEEQEKKEYEEFVAKKEAERKAEQAERKAEEEKRKKEREEAEKKEKEAEEKERKAHEEYEKERKESNDYFSSEPGKKDTWSEDWETDKPGYKHDESYKSDEYSEYDAYGKKKHRQPRYFENYPDPADPAHIADPKCHVDFSPFYNPHEYKFACFAEKPGHRVIEGTVQRPTNIRAGLQCCDPEDNLNYPHGYPGAHHGYPDDLPIIKALEVVNDCNFTITYFPLGDLSHDGLCVGTVEAHCLFNKPCHAADHPLEYTLHGVVKAKPAKIRVETTSEAEVPESSSYNYTYGGSYGYGAKEEYLPGTSLIAYLTDEPSETPSGTKSDYYGAAAHGKVLLKYVINWYNDIVTIPNETGEIDTITPGAPVELSNHAHLPLVEVGTVGLFVKQEHHYDDAPYGAGKPPGYGGPGPHAYGKPPGPKYIH